MVLVLLRYHSNYTDYYYICISIIPYYYVLLKR